MKKFPLLSLIILLVSCSTDIQRKLVSTSFKLRTSNKQLQSNFDSCLGLTVQLIKSKINNKEFAEYFSLNTRATGFVYNYVERNMSDSLFELPKTYHIFYDFVYKSDTLTSFRVDFDSMTKVIDYSNFHLLAFRKFIDKELTITKKKAIEIAIKNGMKRKDLEPILNCSAGKFYWECKNNCDDCLNLDIDAKTGTVIGQGKTIYTY